MGALAFGSLWLGGGDARGAWGAATRLRWRPYSLTWPHSKRHGLVNAWCKFQDRLNRRGQAQGDRGGITIVAQGTPEDIAASPCRIQEFLAPVLEKSAKNKKLARKSICGVAHAGGC